MHVLFIFLDGVGLGVDDPSINPLASNALPFIHALLGGRNLLAATAPYVGPQASLLALDACMGVAGLPQSATGQAALLTGLNVPALIGYHYGPKPNADVASFLLNGNLFSQLVKGNRQSALLNAYPPRYFDSIQSGRRMFSAIPLAATRAGLSLKTKEDLFARQALSADFTGLGWRQQLGMPDAPLLTPVEAGRSLAELARQTDFSFFEYWASDYAGHHQDFKAAIDLLSSLDQVLQGLVDAWAGEDGIILITSDHGNLEDLSTRRHTLNPVPLLLIGPKALRQSFAASIHDLTGLTPAVLDLLPAVRNPR